MNERENKRGERGGDNNIETINKLCFYYAWWGVLLLFLIK